MDVDWEVEIGGGAPLIEADWPGLTDLRGHPERIGEIAEAAAFPPLADLLIRLNSPASPVWTSKSDVWEPESGGLACYVDLIPNDRSIFAKWEHLEGLCRALVEQIIGCRAAHDEPEREATITLVVRQAIAGQAEGFGVTAYFSSGAESALDATTAISGAMVAFSNAILSALK